MILLLESFGPYATADLPATGKWTSAAGVTIVSGGGRSGDPNDNCAAFSTALSSVLSRTLTPAAVDTVYTGTYGFALQVLTLGASATLASLRTAATRLNLILLDTGALQVRQVTGGVDLGVVCQSAGGVVPRATGGCYVEVKARFIDGLSSAIQVRVSDQYGSMNPVAQGPLLAAADAPWTTFRLGGGVAEEAATWRVADVYVTDGQPAATVAIAPDGRLVANDGYLGNVHVEAVYPTADGVNLTVGNTPWTPNSGVTHYTQVDEHPPDGDVTYELGDAEQMDVYVYQSPRRASLGFGRYGCFGAYIPLYAIQWDGDLRVEDIPVSVFPIVRRIVTGTIAEDVIAQLQELVVEDTAYLYFPVVIDRDPTNANQPWSMAVVLSATTLQPGDMEFGIKRYAGGSPPVSIPVGAFFQFGVD